MKEAKAAVRRGGGQSRRNCLRRLSNAPVIYSNCTECVEELFPEEWVQFDTVNTKEKATLLFQVESSYCGKTTVKFQLIFFI